MQTTPKELIKHELLATCLEVTRRMREKDEKRDKKRTFTREQQVEIEGKLRSAGWDADKTQTHMEMFAILHDAPELKTGSMIPKEMFAVVVLQANVSRNHAYILETPCITTHEKQNYLLHNDGAPLLWQYQVQDKPRLATDEEVNQCIESLNDKQWLTIMTNTVFKAFIDGVMNKPIIVEGGGSNGEHKEGEDIQLGDGRTIIA